MSSNFITLHKMVLLVKCFVETLACDPLNERFWAVLAFIVFCLQCISA